MHKSVILTLTDDEALTIRMALNGASMEWGVKANAYLEAGNLAGADTCNRIRAEHGLLWDRVRDAQAEAWGQPPLTVTGCGMIEAGKVTRFATLPT